MDPEVLVFDVGNVVLDFDFAPLVETVVRATGRTPASVFDWFRNSTLENDFECGRVSPRAFHEAVRAGLSLALAFDAFAAAWNRIFAGTPGMEELLGALAPRRRLLAATNTNALHLAHVRAAFPVMALFEAVVASCEVGCRKPDPAFYDAVVRRAAVPADRLLFVDDLEGNVQGAVRAGLHSVLFTGAEDLRNTLGRMGLLPDPAS